MLLCRVCKIYGRRGGAEPSIYFTNPTYFYVRSGTDQISNIKQVGPNKNIKQVGDVPVSTGNFYFFIYLFSGNKQLIIAYKHM